MPLGVAAKIAETAIIVELYGEERGLHARSAVGMAELPWDIPVEIESIVEVVEG